MIDMVEARIIAGQISSHLLGKRITAAELAERKQGSMRDTYLLTVTPDVFRTRLEGTTLSAVYAKYRHVCLETDGGFGLDIWDVYGKILCIEKGSVTPGNPPICLSFTDGSRLFVLPGVWGAMRLAQNEELRAFRDSSNPDVLDTSSDDFTVDALKRLLRMEAFQENNVKQMLSKHDTPGIMSMMGAYNQEALYRARIHPKKKVKDLADEDIVSLHHAMQEVTQNALKAGGRASERDLFDKPGGFVPSVSRETEGKACPVCGSIIEKVKMGGAGKYYICPGCQVL